MLNKKAVVDKLDGDLATILIGDEEKELIVNIEKLPREAAEGSWLNVVLDEKGFVNEINIDEDETTVVKNRINDKLNLLKNMSKSNFKTK